MATLDTAGLGFTNSAVVTCAIASPRPISFVADPFLVLAHEMPSTLASKGYIYMFFEMKNTVTGLGEIGVARSNAGGKSWNYVGEALVEPYHLSYPFIVYDDVKNLFFMIPESSQALSVCIYQTTPEKFPFGWHLVKVALSGRTFVDTSIVKVDSRFFIFTSADYSLYIYSTDDIFSDWVAHPFNPVVKHNRKIGRSAGKATLIDGRIIRTAQDCSNFYGEKVYLFEVNVTDVEYSEMLLHTLKPPWNIARFHHIDLHVIPRSPSSQDNTFFVAFDVDWNPDNYVYFQREGNRPHPPHLPPPSPPSPPTPNPTHTPSISIFISISMLFYFCLSPALLA